MNESSWHTSPSPSSSRHHIRHWILSWCHGALLASSLWYCYHVFSGAAEACYVIPCYEGPGLQALWKVNKGVTFTGESSGIFALAHASVGWWMATYHSRAHAFLLGILAGCTLCAALLSLNMIWVWGAEWNLLGDMTRLNPNNTIFDESGRHMSVNKPLIGVFQQLFYTNICIGLLQSAILIEFLVNGSKWIRIFRIHADEEAAGGGSADEMTPLQRG
jgi:hypothetical protein